MSKVNGKEKLIVNNKKANYEYFLGEKYECGIVLTGTEIKSIRDGFCSFNDSFVRIESGEAYIYGFHIAHYFNGNIFNTDPDRVKKLLLHKSELLKLNEQFKVGGIALIPTKVYLKDGKAKVEISVCKGKHLYDKRQTIAKRDANLEIQRNLKER